MGFVTDRRPFGRTRQRDMRGSSRVFAPRQASASYASDRGRGRINSLILVAVAHPLLQTVIVSRAVDPTAAPNASQLTRGANYSHAVQKSAEDASPLVACSVEGGEVKVGDIDLLVPD